MIRRLARRSIYGLVSGFLLMGATLVAGVSLWPLGDDWGPPLLLAYLTGAALYLWGCACLAEAKGHSTAIILTAFLGTLVPGSFFRPLLLLLVLPDKNAHAGRRRPRG
jgi:hypothetical protein